MLYRVANEHSSGKDRHLTDNKIYISKTSLRNQRLQNYVCYNQHVPCPIYLSVF